MNRSLRRPAFTLIELLVVIAILGVLAAMLMGGVQKVRNAAARTYCQNNLRQIALALHSYEEAVGTFPQGNASITLPKSEYEPYPGLSWMGAILPQLGENNVWQQAEVAFTKDKYPHNAPPHPGDKIMRIYSCPADRRVLQVQYVDGFTVALTSYLGVSGTDLNKHDGMLYSRSRVTAIEVSNADGLGNTLMVGERPPSADLYYGWWYAGAGQWDTQGDPRDYNSGSCDVVMGTVEINLASRPGVGAANCPRGPYRYKPGQLNDDCDQFHFWSLHDGGANFAFGDCSVRFIPYRAAPLMPALGTRNGGENVSLGF